MIESGMVRVQRMDADDWQRVSAIRLEALRDAPDSFARTFDDEQALAPEDWRARLRRAATFLANEDGLDVGMVTGAAYRGQPGAAGLFGMWLAPRARGRGIADRLVDQVIGWARSGGFERLLLEVGDDNTAAIRLYERKGFAATGERGSLPAPRTHVLEHERELIL